MALGDKCKIKPNTFLPILEQIYDKELFAKIIAYDRNTTKYGVSINPIGIVAFLDENDFEIIPDEPVIILTTTTPYLFRQTGGGLLNNE